MQQEALEQLRNKLETERDSVQKELETFASKDQNSKDNWTTKFPNREDGDKDDEADEVQEYENMLSVEHSLEIKLKDIHTALEKMEKGEYGTCEKCGKEIEHDRLDAMPEARLCMTCNNAK